MYNDVILPKSFATYCHDVVNVAKSLGTKSIFNYTTDGKLYVYCEGVILIGSTGFLYGTGTTLEDACCDYMRKIRGSKVRNDINNKEGSFI